MILAVVAKSNPPPEKEDEDGKASDSIRVRMGADFKDLFKEELKKDRFLRGNMSEFVNECARAFLLQRRRGDKIARPLEFVREVKPPDDKR